MVQVIEISNPVELENKEISDKDIPKIIDDIVSRMEQWGFYPLCDDDLDIDGNLPIHFRSTEEVDKMMRVILKHSNTINKPNFVRETFWNFIIMKCPITIQYNEGYETDEDELDIDCSIRIPLEYLPKFKELFFETFPSMEYIHYVLSSIINE